MNYHNSKRLIIIVLALVAMVGCKDNNRSSVDSSDGYNQADSYSHNSHTNHNKLSCPMAYDICGDARQELILGNEIYDVVINNPNGTLGNHATLTKNITPPNNIIKCVIPFKFSVSSAFGILFSIILFL